MCAFEQSEKGMKYIMIILSKKRILLVIGMLAVAMFVFVFQTANVNKSVQTVALPVSNKVIVLDARTWKAR